MRTVNKNISSPQSRNVVAGFAPRRRGITFLCGRNEEDQKWGGKKKKKSYLKIFINTLQGEYYFRFSKICEDQVQNIIHYSGSASELVFTLVITKENKMCVNPV